MRLLFFSSYAHLILTEGSTRTSGGAELQMALLAREIATRGHEVILAGGDMGQPDHVTLQGVRTRNAGKFHTGKLGEMIGAIPRVFRVLREEKPDWVIVMGWTAWLFILWAMRPLIGYRLDFICALDTEVNGEYRKANPVFGALFEFAMRRCDARHAITRDQIKHYEARGMTATFYRYLLFPRTKPLTGEKTVDFLWVSRCQPIKRPHLFLDLVEAMPDASFEMICPAENKSLYDEISSRASRYSNLTFRESVPYHQIQDHYDAARIFVNTSDWEGWPNSFIQAGLGLAALLSLDVNPDSLFQKYALGAFAAGNFDSFKASARAMISDSGALAAMQKECARFVDEMHNNVKETDAFLSGLTSR